ncbi:hypothetical protein B0J13DRAFT_671592 [Dactylonectria estremocensis]|uniref:Aminoglycoside phosphotransferase domain-containing protein n=1 Tax=Dactylonectria estremocensis TaxID=1079267 RepID=A0A9P9JH96_9HYPO|nr:hypothetical protein B0J13DRAFT_671592 [Dactylonectria estremocensis]
MAPRNFSPITVPGGQVVASNFELYDGNLLVENKRSMRMMRLPAELWVDRHNILAIVNHHLGSQGGLFTTVEPREDWGEGEFKLSFMVEGERTLKNAEGKVFVQVFEPISNGEDAHPGAVEERMRVDIASWALFRKASPGIRTPQILGFGFPNGSQFTHVSQMSQEDIASYVRRREEMDPNDVDTLLTPFVADECGNKMPVGCGYIIYEAIEGPGKLLGDVWNTNQTMAQNKTLWSSLASLILNLARTPRTKIGSYSFNNDGTATLSNRPGYNTIFQLERDGGTPTMRRDKTYTSSTEFVEDVLRIQDDRVVKHPNAIASERHCREQMSFRTILHGLIHHLIHAESCDGVFVPQIIDFDLDHFMVDEDWNIICVLDVGSIAVLPIEMVHEPEWLTGVLVDVGENTFSARIARPGFIHLVRQRQRELGVEIRGPAGTIQLADVMREVWDTKAYWFFLTLMTAYDMSDIAGPELLPRFSELCDEEVEEVGVSVWGPDPAGVVQRAMQNRYRYFRQIADKFGPGGELGPDREELRIGGVTTNFI